MSLSQEREAWSAALPRSDMRRSYDVYFSSGLYLSRYPRPNRRTLRLLESALPMGGRLLDYGAGEGRYCFPLAESRRASVVAVDISPVARQHLSETAARLGLGRHIEVCDADDATYAAAIRAGGFDVVLLGFGVLGHIAGRARRIALLTELRSALGPSGRLVLGLPNTRRRFRAVQIDCRPLVARGELEPGDIRYHRTLAEGEIPLFYHLFTEAEIRSDLAEAGFHIERLTIESVLPESTVTHSALLGRADDLLAGLLPPGLGYGFLVSARPA